jgi:hypothetical protein
LERDWDLISGILDMFSTMLSGGGNRRATSLGKGHLSQAAAARLARTSSWNDGLDGAGIPTTPSTNNETTTFSSAAAATTGHHSILRVSPSVPSVFFLFPNGPRDNRKKKTRSLTPIVARSLISKFKDKFIWISFLYDSLTLNRRVNNPSLRIDFIRSLRGKH